MNVYTDNNNNIFLKNINKREGDAMSVVVVTDYGYILWLIKVQYRLVSTS